MILQPFVPGMHAINWLQAFLRFLASLVPGSSSGGAKAIQSFLMWNCQARSNKASREEKGLSGSTLNVSSGGLRLIETGLCGTTFELSLPGGGQGR